MVFGKKKKARQELDGLWKEYRSRSRKLEEKKTELEGYDHKQHIGW